MTAKEKISQGRLSMLQLAERLRNVSEACRRRGVSRSQFYEYKRAFQEQGFAGLADLPPIARSCPHKTPEEARKRVIEMSLAHPRWGKQRIFEHLLLEGILVRPSTVYRIQVREGLESKAKRILRLEQEANGKEIELTEEQVKLIERANPCFRERHVESAYPGYLLSQDTFTVGKLKGIGTVYLQAVVDTYGSYAFGKLYTSKRPETAADVLYDRVLPFYENHGIRVQHVLTDNGSEYCGKLLRHPYELFLALHDIAHRRTKVATPRTNGFVERFNRTILDEFFSETFRYRFYASLDELQYDLDRWLHHYNNERPHKGYRNMGRRPIETIELGKKLRQKAEEEAA